MMASVLLHVVISATAPQFRYFDRRFDVPYSSRRPLPDIVAADVDAAASAVADRVAPAFDVAATDVDAVFLLSINVSSNLASFALDGHRFGLAVVYCGDVYVAYGAV